MKRIIVGIILIVLFYVIFINLVLAQEFTSSCEDSDPNNDLAISGIVIFDGQEYKDSCEEAGLSVRQYFCDSNQKLKNFVKRCEEGTQCVKGKCVSGSEKCTANYDVNDDSIINGVDYLDLLDCIWGKIKENDYRCVNSDLNCDGVLDSLDVDIFNGENVRCEDRLEVCDGVDNNCDEEIDSLNGVPLQYTQNGMIFECIGGSWVGENICLETEDCSNGGDSDCDGLLPLDDNDCVRKGSTQPAAKSNSYTRWSLKDGWSCYADAWNEPDDYYNPAEYGLWGMNSDEWKCFSSTVYSDPGYAFLKYTISEYINLGDLEIGLLWAVKNIFLTLPLSIQEEAQILIKNIVDSIVGGSGIGLNQEEFNDIFNKYLTSLKQPNKFVFSFVPALRGCFAVDAVYSFERDWVCYGNGMEGLTYFDWRDVEGENWISPITDQGGCGSCWDFSAVGAIEAAYNIYTDNPNLDLDLSEQEVLSCSNSGGCHGGANDLALSYVVENGLSTESCFPYAAVDVNGCDYGDECDYTPILCSKQCDERYDIKGYGYVDPNIDSIKFALKERGPLSACLLWSDEIDENGVGKCTGEIPTAGHCIVIVGYNDAGNYWIIKNSWGLGFGDNGYGKIGYGECGIDDGSWGSPVYPLIEGENV